MNRLGTGTRKSKSRTQTIKRYLTETVIIADTDWSSLGGVYQATAQLLGYRWSVKNCLVVDWSGSSTIDSITCSSSTFLTRYTIKLKSGVARPTSSMSITIMSTFDDVFTSSNTPYQNDNYHALKLDNEEFNVNTPLLASLTSNDFRVEKVGSYIINLYVSNLKTYDVFIKSANIVVEDSEQSTFQFGLNDLNFTTITSGTDEGILIHIDLDNYSGCAISSFTISLSVGGDGRQTYNYYYEQ